MKKTQLFIFFAILLTLFTACRNPLLSDPRIYNDDDEKVDITPIVPDEPSFDIEEETPGVENPFDIKDAWFNNASCNGDETTAKEPISSFQANEFDTMGMHSVFDDSNVPHYSFPKTADWSKADEVTHKYSLKGDNTTGKGFPIKNVTYYQYRGYNPLYSEKTNNQLQTTKTGSPLLSRFYFYQFIGDSAAGTLNNFLIAIDTYSKFVFAFAKPTAYKTVVGNQVPTAWGMVDVSNPFYEYDPVGYVKKTAENKYEIEMYDWFQSNLAKGNYEGSINKNYTTVAQKSPTGAGKSPFAKEKAKGFGNNVMGKTYSYRDENGYGLNKIEYSFSDDGKSVTVITTPWNGASYNETVTVNESQDGELTATATVSGNNIILVLNEDNSLSINDQKALVNFKDLGPSFANRVKNNPKYESVDGKVSYEFMNGHNKLKVNGTVYEYDSSVEGHNGRNRAGYNSFRGITWYFIGVELDDTGKFITKTNEKSIVKSVDWGKLNSKAEKVDKLSGKTFFEVVKGQTYSFRELDGYTGSDGQGYGLNLYTYQFNQEGTKATFMTTDWSGKNTIEDKTYDVLLNSIDKTKAVIKIDENNKIDLSLNDTTEMLFVNNDTYILNFKDLGPSFKNRLLGHRKFGNASFNNDLSTFNWDSNNPYHNPKFYNDHRECVIYMGDKWNTKLLYYKVQVEKDENNKIYIRMSNKGQAVGVPDSYLNGLNDSNLTSKIEATD